MTPIEFHTNFIPTYKKKYHEGKEPEEYHIYDCPFSDCEGSQHLYFFPATTTWDCKKCGKKGNVHIFNQHIYNDVCNRNIGGLKDIWKLPHKCFESIRYNPLNECWVLPTFREGKLNNLYKITVVREEKHGEWRDAVRVFGTPSLGTTLFDWPTPEAEEVWVTEGQKDKLAAEAIIGSREIVAVGCPGASSFQARWAMAFQDKNVVLLFDNDKPGKEGMQKVLKALQSSPYKPKAVKRIEWPENTEDGYDLYDLYQDLKARSYSHVSSLLQEVVQEDLTKVSSESVVADDSCDTYEKVLTVMRSVYYVPPDMETVLAIVLASIYSTNLEGEQVWFKIIGRPGCGKSTISKAVSASEFTKLLSTFTGLFSGHKDKEESDNSLIPEIQNRTLIVKDADALLRQGNIEQIMSELRDFYDKDSSVRYRHGLAFEYQNVRSTFILMGTQTLRRADQSFLGERLLSIEMDVTDKEEQLIKKRVAENALKLALNRPTPTTKEVMSSVKGFIGHLKDKSADHILLSDDYVDMIIRLCSLAANMRTQVDRDLRGKLLSPAMSEVPSRLIGQLINTTISLCMVYGVDSPSQKVEQIVKKVIRDTINPRSHRFLICDVILESPGVTAPQLEEKTGLSRGTIKDELRDLVELKFVRAVKVMQDNGLKTYGLWLEECIRKEFSEIIE